MELELTRVDYTVIGVNETNCMKLLPLDLSSEPTQRIAVGDTDGILQVFSIKKEDVQLHFKTLPGPKCSSLKLAGASGTLTDKIFIATQNEVRGFTKKGKLFLSFDTNLTEPISSMFVLGNDLFVCGKHIYNHYRDCKDIGSYLCGDRIIDVIALFLDKSHRLISLIACEGRMIRSLEHARVTHSIEIESSPTVLFIYEADGRKFVLFGSVDGKVGVLDLDRSHTFDRWIINNEHTGSITSMASYDFTKDENNKLVVGRNDGNIEVYTMDIFDKIDKPTCIYTFNCNESVTSLQCGIACTPGFEEIVVSTYTGRIFGLTTEATDRRVGGDSHNNGSYIYSADTSQKIMKLKSEIEDLQGTIIKEREKYQSLTHSFLEEFSAIPTLKIKDSILLMKNSASYTLTLEVPTAIDNVLLQSNVPLDLLDVEKNSAVVSYSAADLKSGNYLLATYRCQMNTNRLEVKIRTIEGQYGMLQVYITPLIQPKFCQLRKYEIKPLSLHLRTHHFDELIERPLNILTVKGAFSLAEIHSWIGNSLPEVPERPNFIEETILNYRSTFLDTILQCKYTKGLGVFKSDNISTIAILKEFLSKQATKKNIKFDVVANISDDSINHVLNLIDPKLTSYLDLKGKIVLVDALHELEVTQLDENDGSSLTKKYRDLLVNEKSLKEIYNKQPSYLERLHGIITDLYVDYNKFKGANAKGKVPKLLEILDNYDYNVLLHFFRPNYV